MISITPQKEAVPICSHSPCPPRLSPATGNYESTFRPDSLFPFWTLHMNIAIHYIAFCVRLLPLSIMFLRFVDVVAYFSTSFLFMAK